MNRMLPAVLAAVVLALAGCAHAPQFTGQTRTASMTGAHIDRMYVYSFVDYRDKELGPDFMKQLERQLGAALAHHGVKSEQLWFRRSPVEATYTLKSVPAGGLNSSTQLPVAEVIAANLPKERALDPQYRLIMFPSNLRTGGGITVDIRWTVRDAKTNNVVWATTSSAHHSVWSDANENAAERAKMEVDGFIAELVKTGMVR
jgi:hypothetical protein